MVYLCYSGDVYRSHQRRNEKGKKKWGKVIAQKNEFHFCVTLSVASTLAQQSPIFFVPRTDWLVLVSTAARYQMTGTGPWTRGWEPLH